MELVVRMNVSDDILEGLKGTSEDSQAISKILHNKLNLQDLEEISINEAIGYDYVVHRLTDVDVKCVLDDSGNEEIQEFFEDEGNFEALCDLIFMKGEFDWHDELSQLVEIFYERLKK